MQNVLVCLQNVLNAEKCKIGNFFKDGISCCLPLDPAVRVKAVDLDVRPLHNTVHLYIITLVYTAL